MYFIPSGVFCCLLFIFFKYSWILAFLIPQIHFSQRTAKGDIIWLLTWHSGLTHIFCQVWCMELFGIVWVFFPEIRGDWTEVQIQKKRQFFSLFLYVCMLTSSIDKTTYFPISGKWSIDSSSYPHWLCKDSFLAKLMGIWRLSIILLKFYTLYFIILCHS